MIGELAWCDGEVVPAGDVLVSGFDRTLLYGLGAFETMRLHGGRPFLVDRHFARLRASLATLSLPVPAIVGRLGEGLVTLARRSDVRSALCRVTVTAGPAPSTPGVEGGMRVFAGLRPAPPSTRGRRIEVGVAPFAHDARSPISGVKSTSYLVHYLLRERAEAAGRYEDLMVDGEGRVTEGTVSSVFVVSGGRLLTPPLSEGVLAGVTRGLVLELARELGIDAEERGLSLAELGDVDECFLTGAGKGLVPVDVVAGRELPAERPVGARVAWALARRIVAECGVDPEEVDF